jgi:hypothetical protein
LGGAYAKTQSKDNWQKTALRERKKMNKEYWQAKVNLCRQVGIEQLIAGDIPNGTRNLKRMVRAMEELNLLEALDEDKPAEDMWASLITNGLLLAGEDKSNG